MKPEFKRALVKIGFAIWVYVFALTVGHAYYLSELNNLYEKVINDLVIQISDSNQYDYNTSSKNK